MTPPPIVVLLIVAHTTNIYVSRVEEFLLQIQTVIEKLVKERMSAISHVKCSVDQSYARYYEKAYCIFYCYFEISS